MRIPRRRFSYALGAATALALVTTGVAPVFANDLKPGDLAPDFTLPGSDGRTYRLSDFRGKHAVVIAWFPKAFTGGWTRECKSLRESGDQIRDFDVVYFTASTDDADTNRRFAESLEADYAILSDPGKAVAKAYGVVGSLLPWASRWTFYIGVDGHVLRVDKDVKTSTAGLDIARHLDDLGIARRHK